MKRTAILRSSTGGYTMVEMALVVAILVILTSIFVTSYGTIQARVRFSSVKANMDSIAKAAFTDYANWGDWDLTTFDDMPPRIGSNNLLSHWPTGPCSGWYFSWEDWSPAGYNAARVTLRRADNTAFLSFCVSTFGGGNCQFVDPLYGGTPIELSSNETIDSHVYCSE